jgi:8-oxo-dGTP pyrophosphatase MutT (NUDIX family)
MAKVLQPRPAASVIVLRPGGAPFEVLMVERSSRGMFGDLMVFPGGAVDEEDRVRQGSREDGHRAAALRELAEETGILALSNGVVAQPAEQGVYQSLASAGGELAMDSLVLISRWVTPTMAATRFDTLFFLLPVTDTPYVRVDGTELRSHAWVTPQDALRLHDEGQWRMILPTVTHLRWLARRNSIDDALASARGADGRTLIRPEVASDGSIIPIHLPAEDE